MKKSSQFFGLLALVTVTSLAHADPWKDESGHGKRGKHGEYKEEFWDGNCKVERKYEKHGGYKEERKCKGPRQVRERYQPVVRERVVRETYVQPVYVDERRREPGVSIDVHIGQ